VTRHDLILTGPPGSGKGTQAARLATQLGIPKISTGDMLRDAAASGRPPGSEVKGIMARGELVPDSMVADLVRERLGRGDTEKGFILDGFPRTQEQAKTLDALLRGLGRAVSAVVVLEVPDEELVRRILTRGEGRADDEESVVRRRLAVYRAQTEPVLEHYDSALVRVHGVGLVEEIQTAILEALGA
jgi:adenylate kinase